MTQHSTAEAFWRFSLLVYGRPGVAEALLALQDRSGHNVNLILYALWQGVCRPAPLDAPALVNAKAAIEKLDREVVLPLRRMRGALKDDPDPDARDLRRRVLALEIAAERRLQARLALPRPSGAEADGRTRREIAEANLRLILGQDFDSNDAMPLRQMLAEA
ncbi:MAG TPA: TIGR02444 family protein [Stellaceae bacterium]|nr:TIGR02444 family protein [Stellaceae bacterium]